MATETSQTLDRGLRVLEVVAESADGLTVTELAAALGIGRTVVYRLVVTLEQHAFIRRARPTASADSASACWRSDGRCSRSCATRPCRPCGCSPTRSTRRRC